MQEPPYNDIASLIRELLLESVPGIEEKFSFKVPFYHYYGMFCYINKTKQGIELNFCRGKDLTIAWPQLQMKERIMVAGISFEKFADLRKYNIKAIIAGAAAWQVEASKQKISLVRKNKK